ncbi:MAG TPA: hypothetical protein K8V85_09515 [Staphylococcus kloosii]|uniref:Uncharacterized protein n=1 Tax=Staphylococcus kloosii TaxID=29384 RepID=A0A921GZA6_9STAP|nr:hypothetical protein [Staphylococcus kloosii]HJF68534.1 hypothetical protein [Staphylococcus kloosii]
MKNLLKRIFKIYSYSVGTLVIVSVVYSEVKKRISIKSKTKNQNDVETEVAEFLDFVKKMREEFE